MPHPKGGYKLADGTPVPGTTTISGRFKNAGGLLWWAFEQGKAAEQGLIESLYDKRDQAGDAGTLAHAMVEADIRGTEQPDTTNVDPETVALAQQGYGNFLEWENNSSIEIVEQEMVLVSEAHRFGGCPDAIGIDAKGRLCLLDWKTSNGVYTDYLVQIAAYGILWEENHPDQPLVGGYHLLRFSKENADFAHYYWADLSDARKQFLLYREAYDLDKRLKKRC